MRLPPELRAQIVEHAQRVAPKECCGVIGVRDDEAFVVHETRNRFDSPFRFEPVAGDLDDAWESIDQDGGVLGAIYHSHTRSEPYPSQTDVNYAKNPLLQGIEWLIVGLGADEPVLRSFLIDKEGVVTEVDVL